MMMMCVRIGIFFFEIKNKILKKYFYWFLFFKNWIEEEFLGQNNSTITCSLLLRINVLRTANQEKKAFMNNK